MGCSTGRACQLIDQYNSIPAGQGIRELSALLSTVARCPLSGLIAVNPGGARGRWSLRLQAFRRVHQRGPDGLKADGDRGDGDGDDGGADEDEGVDADAVGILLQPVL
jgi:hypothetical protein